MRADLRGAKPGKASGRMIGLHGIKLLYTVQGKF